MSLDAGATPAMAQYQAAKRQHPDCLLFFRLGDFYELFHEDAKEASRALGLTLTSRSKGENAIPMAGVPVRAVDGYLRRLVQKGFKVAICEQVQDPREARGVVERRVVRVITPGTLTEDSLLDGTRPNHLLACCGAQGAVGLAWVELSTGAFRVDEVREERLADELARIEPAEVLLPEDQTGLADLVQRAGAGALTRRAPYAFGRDAATRVLHDFFRVATLEAFGLAEVPLALCAAGALVEYLQETQLATLPHIRHIEVQAKGAQMLLDRATRQSLELVETLRGGAGEAAGLPLLRVLDGTRTPMGARLLRAWLLAPLTEPAAIGARHDAVAEIFADSGTALALGERLSGIQDLERLTARVATGRANARDLVALRISLERVPGLQQALAGCTSPGLARIHAVLDPMPELAGAIARCLVDEPPIPIKEGGLVRDGFDRELDELRSLSRDSKAWMARFQAREAERTGIANLKVGFNSVFGYYIEITQGNRHVPVPAEYVRKQTTKNAERYVTDELKAFETKALRGEELARTREYDLFLALREQAAAEIPRLQRVAALVAELDVLAGLAWMAKDRGWVRPLVDDSRTLQVEDGRHPVIEATHPPGTFVPNDTDLDPPQRRLVILTGPNMAGKSTFIRQNALLVLMAQMGSFVPAKRARIGVVDRVFTRVGAADDISRGASTFMVEMVETANILRHATARSLVILDEVGRGTSTYDGLSLAHAIAEDLHDRIGCRALFATHYHQLSDLAGPGRGVVNLRVAVREWGEEVVFLHRIEAGGTDKSYGLHVARLAGIPESVLRRARAILAGLEQEEGRVAETLAASRPEPREPQRQLSLFASPRESVLRELERLVLDQLTPLQALQKLAEWQARTR